MAEQTVPRCACGGGAEPEGGTKRIIFACAGASKAGQISNEAAVQLTNEGYGKIACTASLAVGTPSIKKKVEAADEVIVIDGCPVGCARQIAEMAGVTPDQEIVVTDLGIEKGGGLDLSEEDVETVVSAAWEGRGREKQEQKPEDSGGCGCGCGTDCGCEGSTDTLVVEWRHIGRDIENTCGRCGETGKAVRETVDRIRAVLEDAGITVKFVENVLPHDAVADSNSILFNGVPLEDLIEGMEVTSTPCASCACITGQDDVECRAVEYGGERYESIPPELIARAVLKALGLE
ncbi:MAG TPA: putative zinc-binding protein [Methanoculleus sp.]|nr:putative zinc-binding protein [Methanoculleus sp.]